MGGVKPMWNRGDCLKIGQSFSPFYNVTAQNLGDFGGGIGFKMGAMRAAWRAAYRNLHVKPAV
jgi:hypothetical protein